MSRFLVSKRTKTAPSGGTHRSELRRGRRVPKSVRFLVATVLLLALAGGVRAVAEPSMPPDDPPAYRNPVMDGDFPDPTAVRIGPEYWAISTKASGQPSPPILRSPDLVHWTVAGYLYTQAPSWSNGRQVWGPWLVRDGDRYLVYYSARKKYG